jgi:RNA polymerase subunit RPABC4/transcription elongation factor Spt4
MAIAKGLSATKEIGGLLSYDRQHCNVIRSNSFTSKWFHLAVAVTK